MQVLADRTLVAQNYQKHDERGALSEVWYDDSGRLERSQITRPAKLNSLIRGIFAMSNFDHFEHTHIQFFDFAFGCV